MKQYLIHEDELRYLEGNDVDFIVDVFREKVRIFKHIFNYYLNLDHWYVVRYHADME